MNCGNIILWQPRQHWLKRKILRPDLKELALSMR
nr:MAG TPA: hypothetical protein [Caudoviricetes sp.]